MQPSQDKSLGILKVPSKPAHSLCTVLSAPEPTEGRREPSRPLPLPRPGGSACARSRPSERWAPAAAGRPCCWSGLWSAEQTSPSLEHAGEKKDKFNHILKAHGHSHHKLRCQERTPPRPPQLPAVAVKTRAQKSTWAAQVCGALYFSPALPLYPITTV